MNEDPNREATRVVREATESDSQLSPDIEAAWAAWIGGIQQVDERVRTLLRAAFEAGIDAAAGTSGQAR